MKTRSGPPGSGPAEWRHHGRSTPQSASGFRLPMKTWCGGYASASSKLRSAGLISSAASSRVGFEPWRTRSGACARTREQPWIAALILDSLPPRNGRIPSATGARLGDRLEVGGGSGRPQEESSRFDLPDGGRLDVGFQHLERPPDDPPPLLPVQP